jgi:hypothetical protein
MYTSPDPADPAPGAVDLRILALADSGLLPPEVQEPFDRWRILRARDAVADIVRRRLIQDRMLELFLERLEAADDESMIFEGIYALAEAVELHRGQLGLHSHYIVIIMAGQLNPWGLLRLARTFDAPGAGVVRAAAELWQLAEAQGVEVYPLLAQVVGDELLTALDAYYREHPLYHT